MDEPREALAMDPRLTDLAEFRFRLRSFLSFSESAAEEAGITAQHYQLLQVVGVGGEQGSSITEIARRMLLRHNSAVELVDRAERAGLVRRAADRADQRRSLVCMTEKGEQVLTGLVAQHLQHIESIGQGLIDAVTRLTGTGQAQDAQA